ncbi:MAG: GNAT family N-acetyltransferase [Halobacteriales archaeon]|nr:GNAT family N-acetyltransferase [Halobacteriales archaeon]
MRVTVRQATRDDEADVVGFTRDTWPDRGGDYLPDVFADWVAADGEAQRTFVAERDGEAVGIVQCVLLTDREAWMQGMRVAPAARGQGVSVQLHHAAAAWAREQGATVGRNMVFSWNAPALAASRAAGLEPATEFRWAHPGPDAGAEPDLAITADPAAAWTFWGSSAAREHLRGLALAPGESWALCELTEATLERAAEETFLAAVQDDGLRGLTFRVRDDERETDEGELERWAEYGVAAWADPAAAAALLDAVRADAATVGADRVRVLLPETAQAVSDAALAGAGIADEPDFVLADDLTRRD